MAREVNDGLWDAFNNYHMGITTENIVEKYGFSREEQDAFAAASQIKAEAALQANRFADEIIPVVIPQRKGDPVVFDRDEQPRAGVTAGVTADALGKLRPRLQEGRYRPVTHQANPYCGSRETTLAMVYKLRESTQKNLEKTNGFNLLTLMVNNVEFEDGEQVTDQSDRNATILRTPLLTRIRFPLMLVFIDDALFVAARISG